MELAERKVHEPEDWPEQLLGHFRDRGNRAGRSRGAELVARGVASQPTKHFLTRASQFRSEPATRCKNLRTQIEKLKEQHNNILETNETTLKENNAISESINKLIQDIEKAIETKNNLQKDKELFRKELIKTYEAFKIAKVYYKERLALFYCKDSQSNQDQQVVYIEFFTTKKKNLNTVTVSKNIINNQYTLLDMNPKLPIFDDLAKRLRKTGDIPGFLCCVRACFIQIGNSNKKS